MASFGAKLKHAWDAFTNTDDRTRDLFGYGGTAEAHPQDRRRYHRGYGKELTASIYNRIAIDAAQVDLRHVKLDEQGRYVDDIDSGLNECLQVRANLDQEARAFRHDVVQSMLEEGVIAIVPVKTTLNPNVTGGYDILDLRVGTIVGWAPQQVQVRLYNEKTGERQDLWLDKSFVAIATNPFYAVMNQPNSTLQRLLRKLRQLDAIDDQSSSGKLDLIIQLPYVIKSEAKRQQAEQRRRDIEVQLKGSQYGIAYTDGTEKVTQLNRPAENNLFKQVEYLEKRLFAELGLTEEIMNLTADEKTMLNYNNRTIEPILTAPVEAMRAKFLTKTARTQGQSVAFFRDPFKLVPLNDIAEIADKFTRNEIISSNEVRGFIGMRPSTDPKADELRNSNMPAPSEPATSSTSREEGDSQNGT